MSETATEQAVATLYRSLAGWQVALRQAQAVGAESAASVARRQIRQLQQQIRGLRREG